MSRGSKDTLSQKVDQMLHILSADSDWMLDMNLTTYDAARRKLSQKESEETESTVAIIDSMARCGQNGK